MKMLRWLLLGTLVAAPVAVWAHGKEAHKNLKVLEGVEHKALDKGMKSLAQGLGVKCTACHVKEKFDLDDVPAKGEARKFLSAALKSKGEEERRAALAALLRALEKTAPKDEAKVWSAIDLWKKSQPSGAGHEKGGHYHEGAH